MPTKTPESEGKSTSPHVDEAVAAPRGPAPSSKGRRPSSIKRKRRRSRRKKGGWLPNLVHVLVVAALVPPFMLVTALQTSWGQDRLRDAAIEIIHSELGLDANIQQVGVNFLPLPHLHVNQLELTDPVYGPLASAEDVNLHPSLLRLLVGRFRLHRIELNQPHLRLVVRDNRIINLPFTRKRNRKGNGEFPFDKLIANNASVELEASEFGDIKLAGVHFQLDATSATEMDCEIQASGGQIHHSKGTEDIQQLAIHLNRSGQTLHVDEGILRTPFFDTELKSFSIELPPRTDNNTPNTGTPNTGTPNTGTDQPPVRRPKTWKGSASLRVDLAQLDRLPHNLKHPPLQGVAHINLVGERSDAGTVATGELHVEHAKVGKFGLGDLDATIEANEESLNISQGTMHIIKGGGQVGFSGSLGLKGSKPLDVELNLQGLEFEYLMEQLGVTPNTIVQWDLTGTSRIRGTLDPLQLNGPLRLETQNFKVTQDAWHIKPARHLIAAAQATGQAQISVRPDGVRFQQVLFKTPKSTIDGNVFLGFHGGLNIAANGDVDLQEASPLVIFPMAGRGTVHVDVVGNNQTAVMTGNFKALGFEFAEFRLGDVESRFSMDPGTVVLRFPHVVGRKASENYEIENLVLDFTDQKFRSEGRFSTKRFTLANVYHIFGFETDERFAPYQGTLQGSTNIRYTLGYPGDASTGTMVADLNFQLPSMSLYDFKFTDGAVKGKWTWHNYEMGYLGGELDLEHFHLKKGAGTVVLQGNMELGGRLQMTTAVDRFTFRETEGIGDNLPNLEGVYGVLGDIRGTVEIPRGRFDITASGMRYDNVYLGDGRIYVRMTDKTDPWVRAAAKWDGDPPEDEPCGWARQGFWKGRWKPDPPLQTVDGPTPVLTRPMAYLVCGSGLNNQVKVDLAMGRTEVYPLRGRLWLNQFDLSPLLRELTDQNSVQGKVSAGMRFTGGSALEDNTLVGSLLIHQLQLKESSVEVHNDGPIEINLDRGELQIDRAVVQGTHSKLAVSGKASIQRGIDMNLDGAMDLDLLALLSSGVLDSEGTAQVRINLRGPIEDPGAYGRAEIRGGGLRVTGYDRPIQNVIGDFQFTGKDIAVQNIHAEVAGGSIDIGGTARLKQRGLERFQVDVESENISFTPQEDLDITLSSSTSLRWSEGQRLPRLTGTLRLGRVVYEKPIALSQTLDEISRTKRTSVQRYDPENDHIEIDLRVEEQTPIRVANNLIDAEMNIEDSKQPFRLVGTDQRFGAIGTLTIPRGTVHFRNTDFDIRRGLILFDDPQSFTPHLDISAETRIRRAGGLTGPRWRVLLQATGDADAMKLTTSSTPALPQEDILLLLTMGMTRAEADQLQAGDVTGTAAIEALATVTGLDREVREVVPVIDDFQITSRYSVRSNRTEPQVTIGKRITDKVRVRASTGLSEGREIRTGVEWQLNDETSVEAAYDNINTTTASSIGNVGVDLRWRLEFE